MQGEWRQRLINGAYTIRAAGIHQEDKDVFVRTDGTFTPGYRDDRGLIESHGEFWLNDRWSWGWDAVLLSDKTFLQDYDLNKNAVFGQKETRSQLFLTGQGDRSFFDVRSVYYMGLSEYDSQKQLPIVHPVLDYNYTFAPPVYGGELGFDVNLTSLSRTDADFDGINGNTCYSLSADISRDNCLMRGAPGTYTRLTADLHWKRTLIEPTTGQVLTPFMKVRGDTAWRDATDRPYVGEFINTENEVVTRGMPTVGVEYRWPFIAVQSWGTQTIEPIAQMVVRPNETEVGKLPNEDAQSLVFDDTNLFVIDKYSGYDRQEGGGRLNAGVKYSAQLNGAGAFSALFGQSYQLFGINSFALADMANTGLDSGLETQRSDYVAGLAYQPDNVYTLSSHYRFDNDDFSVRRLEIQATAKYERVTLHHPLWALCAAASAWLHRLARGRRRRHRSEIDRPLVGHRGRALRYRQRQDRHHQLRHQVPRRLRRSQRELHHRLSPRAATPRTSTRSCSRSICVRWAKADSRPMSGRPSNRHNPVGTAVMVCSELAAVRRGRERLSRWLASRWPACSAAGARRPPRSWPWCPASRSPRSTSPTAPASSP